MSIRKNVQDIVIPSEERHIRMYPMDFEATDTIKRDILTLYRADIVKHVPGYEQKVEGILDELPSQLSKHEKKFSLSSLGKGTRFRNYESAFLWLEDSMLVNMCYNSTEPNLGLKLNLGNAIRFLQ